MKHRPRRRGSQERTSARAVGPNELRPDWITWWRAKYVLDSAERRAVRAASGSDVSSNTSHLSPTGEFVSKPPTGIVGESLTK